MQPVRMGSSQSPFPKKTPRCVTSAIMFVRWTCFQESVALVTIMGSVRLFPVFKPVCAQEL